MKTLSWFTTLLVVFAMDTSVQGEIPEKSSYLNVLARKIFREMIGPWHAQQYKGCEKYFAKDVTGRGQTSFQEAVAQIGDRRGFSLHTGTTEVSREEGAVVARARTYWIAKPVEGVRDKRETRITDETFRFIEVEGKVLIDSYSVCDVTEKVLEKVRTRIMELQAVFSDVKQPKPERLMAGVRMYLDLWQIADFDRMWPALKTMITLGIMQDAKIMTGLQNLTRRAAAAEAPPKAYAAVVQKVIKWRSPGTRPRP